MRSPALRKRAHMVNFRYLKPESNPEHAELVRAVEALYPFDGVSQEAREQFDKDFETFERVGRQTPLLRVLEALDEDQFPTWMRLIQHLKVMDGVMRPRGLVLDALIGSNRDDFEDFELRESMRFTEPGDFVARQTFHDPVPIDEIQELKGAVWQGQLWEIAWMLNFMTTKFGQLEKALEAALSVGARWNRTQEKFVVRNLIEDNPTIKVDGSDVPLFSTSHSGISNDFSGGTVKALTRDNLKGAIQLLSDQRVDNEPVENPARFVMVAADSDNDWVLSEILKSTSKHDDGNANLVGTRVPEVINDRARLTPLRSYYLDKDSWFVLSDWEIQPAFGMAFGYWEGQDSPQVIDVDKMANDFFILNGKNRWLSRGGFGGTMQNYRGIVRGSTKS